MLERFPAIECIVGRKAFACVGLARRLYAEPALTTLARVSRQQFGDAYWGGEIEGAPRRRFDRASSSAGPS